MTVTGLLGVTAAYDRTTALRDVTIEVEPGELLVVLGPSGSGKSTVLRVLAGLTPVRSGRVIVGGQDVTEWAPPKRNVAMVFEADALVPFLNVRHNLGWGLAVRNVPKAETERRVSDRAERMRLGKLLGRTPRTLSAGERAATSVGRALVQRPAAFLLDEPLAHLDAGERARVRREIVQLVAELGVTTLYCTHDRSEAMAMGDRIALLRDGELAQLGTPQNLYHEPINLFVADFLAAPALGVLPATLLVSDGLAGFGVGARVLPRWTPVPERLSGRVGAEILLGLRAEDVRPAELGSDVDAVTVDAVVSAVERTGRDTFVTALVPPIAGPGGGPAELHAVFPGRSEVRAGDDVRLAIDATRAHVFAPATGDALWHPEV